jgi:23S rRNA (cytosine1962-C5)-methyltransferase
MSTLIVQPRSRLFHGHVWIYALEIQKRLGDPQPGDVVRLQDVRGKPLGSAIYNPKSQISARLFSYRRQDLDLELFTWWWIAMATFSSCKPSRSAWPSART